MTYCERFDVVSVAYGFPIKQFNNAYQVVAPSQYAIINPPKPPSRSRMRKNLKRVKR